MKKWIATLLISSLFGLAQAKETTKNSTFDAFESILTLPTNFNQCKAHFVDEKPKIRAIKDSYLRELCFTEFAVLYSVDIKSPIYSIERLTPGEMNKSVVKRNNQFYEDLRLLPEERAKVSDYVGTYFDRGHLTPAADMRSRRAMEESFILSNIAPQNPRFNRVVWSKVERDTRSYAQRTNHDIFVATGVLFENATLMLGSSKVWVPSHFYKAVYDATSKRAWVHFLENSETTKLKPPISYEEFLEITKLDVFGLVNLTDN